jgi:integrase
MAKKAKMKDGIKQRYDGSWSVVVELAPVVDPETGKLKRRQKWVTVRGSREDAVKKRNELRSAVDGNTYVDTSKLTVGEWLEKWWAVEKDRKIKPLRPSTQSRYENVMKLRLFTAPLAKLRLQDVTSHEIEGYYNAQKTISGATLTLDHAILHRAFRKAVKAKLITVNPVADLDERPRAEKRSEAEVHAWTPEEASRFLVAAKKRGPQTHAFYALALETGMRKSELGGLRWANVDLDKGEVRVSEQLTKTGKQPAWGPTKSGASRTVRLSEEMVALLREHRRTQAELKMKNGATYANFGLVFAKEWTDVRQRGQMLGHPLQLNNLGQREYEQLIREAKVKRIKFHGLRHTSATMALQAGEPVHVVSERLGHANVTMTWQVYAHVLKDAQEKAARTMGALLHSANAANG